ncbi:hypothetical protein [Streptomyces sp. SP18CS02]|uniref:hypothetical protein n=1 Tax=Streptomyces sp. SP18CS02 TaxID=3002531 RepID=UPI002E76A6A0|nr:hypothetical protein [Streptomyces sp. SP18CS02]MEE1752963.1 hypothetical protein [Streptomyces sp. SP18CS02]
MRVRAAHAIAAVVTALLATGCGSSPAEEVEDWYSGGGEKQLRQMAEDAGRVNEVSTRTLDVIGTACQDLAKHAPAAETLEPIPDELAQENRAQALTALREGAAERTAGAAAKDESAAGRGVRTIQLDSSTASTSCPR